MLGGCTSSSTYILNFWITVCEISADLLLRQQRHHTPTTSKISITAAVAPPTMTIVSTPLDEDVGGTLLLLARAGACVGLRTAVSRTLKIVISPNSGRNTFGENICLKESG